MSCGENIRDGIYLRKKVLFRIAIALNLFLIVMVGRGIIKMNFVKEQVVITEVTYNLVELEGLIENQIDQN